MPLGKNPPNNNSQAKQTVKSLLGRVSSRVAGRTRDSVTRDGEALKKLAPQGYSTALRMLDSSRRSNSSLISSDTHSTGSLAQGDASASRPSQGALSPQSIVERLRGEIEA